MGLHYDSPEYLDILLMVRRYNVNMAAKPEAGNRIKVELSDFERDICRRLEKTGYTQFQKDIDNLVCSLLKLRRGDSDGKQWDQDTQQMSNIFADVLKKVTKVTSETSQAATPSVPQAVASNPKRANAVAGPSTPKTKPQAIPKPPAKTPFDPMSAKHNEGKFRTLTASTQAIRTPTRPVYTPKKSPPKPSNTSSSSTKPSKRPVRTYIPTRSYRDPSLPKSPLKHYLLKGHPLTKSQGPTTRKPEKTMSKEGKLPSIKGPPSTDANGVRRSSRIRSAEEEARERAERIASEVRKG